MTRFHVAVVLAVGTLLAACQSATDNKASDTKAQDLEKRVAELERKATPGPSPEIISSIPPSWDAQPAPPAAEHRAPARSSARTPSRAPARSAPVRQADAPEPNLLPAPITIPQAPVERPVEPAPAVTTTAPRVVVHDEPEVERISVPAGTQLSLVLETALSSATSHAGDKVTARVERAAGEDGRVLLPGGTVMRGHVVEARSSGRVSGKARVVVAFDEIVVRGHAQRLATTEIEAVAGDSHERDGAMIGGGTVAGAIIGGITGGGKGAGKGAIIGGLAGTGAVLATKGKEVELPAGSRWSVKVRDGMRL